MARTNKPINADELWQLRGTRFLWCQEKPKYGAFSCVYPKMSK